MDNFELDFELVHKTLYKDPNKIPVKGNKHRMIRVAFDLFKLKDDESEDLWQVQADDDGEFLVRTYSLPEEEIVTSDWNVKEDEKQANLTIAYKNIPIQRFAGKDFGANTPEDVSILRGVILRKLAKDKDFVIQFFGNLPEPKKDILKAAGFLKNLRDWLTSQDITDEVMEKIMTVVEKSERPYKKECPYKEEELQDASDYQEYFKEKAKEFGSPTGDPQDIPIEKRKEFFDKVDKEWKGEGECNEGVPFALALLELELRLKQGTVFPTKPEFDISDVKITEKEPKDGSFLMGEEEIDELIKEIENLSSKDQK